MAGKRIYTETEISALLKRTADLQQTRAPVDTSGLTLEELEQIAAEVGLDPALLRTAAAEMEEGVPDEQFHLLGGPTAIDLERIVEGDLTEAKWEAALSEIQHTFKAPGEVEQIGRMRTWMYENQMGERVQVTLAPAGRQTRIRISYPMMNWIWVLHVPLWSGAIAPVILLYLYLNLGPIVETGLALFALAALHMIAHLVFGAISRSKERKVRRLLTRLDERIATPEAATVAQERAAQQDASEAGRIDETLLSDDSERITPGRSRERA